jgi:CDP-diacylglycerol--glycerol-3-phosphate 3-phosphatidyltransferase
MCNYFEKIHRTIGGFSYLLVPDPSAEFGHSTEWPSTNYCANPLEDSKEFLDMARQVFGPLIRRTSFEKKPSAFESDEVDTVVYPLAQFTPLLGPGESTQQHVVAIVLSALCSALFAGARWTFSTPYFNPVSSLRSALLSTTAKQGSMVTGAPQATSFYGTAGLTGYIPAAFTPEARRFLKGVEENHREHQVQLLEWQRGRGDMPGGWTYHAKGLWVAKSAEEDPCMTIVGSSNYGERSFALDLEQDAFIVTKNVDLKKRIGDEERRILEHARRVTREELSTGDRKTGLLVFILLWLIRLIGVSI